MDDKLVERLTPPELSSANDRECLQGSSTSHDTLMDSPTGLNGIVGDPATHATDATECEIDDVLTSGTSGRHSCHYRAHPCLIIRTVRAKA